MVEHLNEWDHRWNEHNLDSKLSTLKTEVFNAKNELVTMASAHSSNMSTLQSSLSSFENRATHLEQRIDTLSTEISLLQLYTLEMISKEQMRSLLKMLASQDTENHTVAHETIRNLLAQF